MLEKKQFKNRMTTFANYNFSYKNMSQKSESLKDENRRKLLTKTAYTTAGAGAACALYPFVMSLNPADDVQALSSVEVDISNIEVGSAKKVMWRGKPVSIRRRSKEEIKAANDVDLNTLRDPQKDSDRVKKGKEEWLVTIEICTHLGCVPTPESGEFDGWFCPCHGSQYDTSARIRKGPAPKNLEIPPYEFLSDKVIKIG